HYRIHREGSRHVEDLPPFPALLSFSPLRPFRRPPSSLFQNRPSWISSSIGCAAEVGAAWTRRQPPARSPAPLRKGGRHLSSAAPDHCLGLVPALPEGACGSTRNER